MSSNRPPQLGPPTIPIEASLEASLAAILGSVADGLIIVDLAGEPVRWNPVAARMLGGIATDGTWVRGRTVFEADETTPIEPADRPLMRALRGEELMEKEIVVVVDGALVHLATSTRALRDDSGVLLGALSLFRDVTASRRAARALEESVVLYRTLIAHLPSTAVLMFDKQMKIVLAGGGAIDVVGSPGELEGKAVRDVALPVLFPSYEAALRGEASEQLCPRGGRLFHMQFLPVKDARGQVFAGLTVGEDITVRNAQLEQLTKAKEELRLTIESAPIGMALIGDGGVWLQVNKALCEIVGYSPAELVTRTLPQLTHPEDRAADRALIEQLRAGTIPSYKLEKRYVRKDGSIAHTMLHVSLLGDERGLPPSFICQVIDLTERKKLEERIALNDRMASIGTLAAGVAHEINNPLAYITLNLDSLAEHLRDLAAEFGEPDGKRAARLREMIDLTNEARGGADRMRKIVLGMKAFSRPEIRESSPQDLPRLLDVAVRMVDHELRLRARVVRLFEPVPRVDADESELTQVFINLLTNAAHAIPEGHAAENEVRLSTRTGPNGEAIVEVADTGSGIEPAILPRIFDPFFTTHALEAGTGLGLSISHGIVAMRGGTLTVESHVGKGSVFRVSLPASRSRSSDLVAEMTAQRVASLRPAVRLRLLVVDDEEAVGRALARVLKKEHEVTVLSSAKAAEELLGRESFDFVLCDLMMPEMTGMALHASIAKSNPELAGRFVFLTGGAFTAAARAFLEAVPNTRFDKPVDLGTLREFLRATSAPR